MRKVIQFFYIFFFKIALWFRYRIKVVGLEKLDLLPPQETRGGILFLSNHSTYVIDSLVTFLTLWPKFSFRPLVAEKIYKMKFVHAWLRAIDAIPIPNLVNSLESKKKQAHDAALNVVIEGIKSKQNFLVFPAGRVKNSALESIGTNSTAYQILNMNPETTIVLVRLKGLWGSSFSRALSDKPPSLSGILWTTAKTLLKNLLFFTPRREIIVEVEVAPAIFPWNAKRLEFNRHLEQWYNRPDGLTHQMGTYPGDSLMLVPYSFWNKLRKLNFDEAPTKKNLGTELPKDLHDKIIQKLVELKPCDPSTILPEMYLASDLGLDALDIRELLFFLHEQYQISDVDPGELTTVGKLMLIVSQRRKGSEIGTHVPKSLLAWQDGRSKQRVQLAPGNTVAEVFLNQCVRAGNTIACADERLGIWNYPQLKLRTLLIAEYIRKLPGVYIGIMLPASVAANLLIIACEIAGKIPLMVNWTVGSRHLISVLDISKVEVVITSWSFLERLDNVDLSAMDDHLLLLEDIIDEISLVDKLKAWVRAKKSTEEIMRIFGIEKVDSHSQAVLLFTSGTEAQPKGVPLSHQNLLSNMRACLEAENVFSDDVIFGILPPFHSFGFSVSGIIGLLSGIKVFYYPVPTEGKRIARNFSRWQATIIFAAPTFLKGILKFITHPGQIKTLRMCITGAEKTPSEIFTMLEKFNKGANLMEGYGITECSPVLTLNPLGGLHQGVGKPLPGVELCIVHPDTEQVLLTGQTGLIVARGPNVFNGYLNKGLSSPFLIINGDSWYKTGDLGFLDSNGYLTISGRLKRFIKMGGEMISLGALEEVLTHKALAKGWTTNQDAPVLAVCAREVAGERSKITLFTTFNVELEEINQALKKSGFSNLVKISNLIRLESMPFTGAGKINYNLLEEKYLNKEV